MATNLWNSINWSYLPILLAFTLALLPVLNEAYPQIFNLGKKKNKWKAWIYVLLIFSSILILFIDKVNSDYGAQSFQVRTDSALTRSVNTARKIEQTTSSAITKVNEIDKAVGKTFNSVDSFHLYAQIFNKRLSRSMDSILQRVDSIVDSLQIAQQTLRKVNMQTRSTLTSTSELKDSITIAKNAVEKGHSAVENVIYPPFPCTISITSHVVVPESVFSKVAFCSPKKIYDYKSKSAHNKFVNYLARFKNDTLSYYYLNLAKNYVTEHLWAQAFRILTEQGEFASYEERDSVVLHSAFLRFSGYNPEKNFNAKIYFIINLKMIGSTH